MAVTMKSIWGATDAMINRKQTYYFVIGLAVVFSFLAVTLGVLGGRSEKSRGAPLNQFEVTEEPTDSPFITPDGPLITFEPSLRPSLRPSIRPTILYLTEAPTENSTEWDFNLTMFPSNVSSSSPVNYENISDSPSLSPSIAPQDSGMPLSFPGSSESATVFPSWAPTMEEVDGRESMTPTLENVNPASDVGTRFYAIGDVPYSDQQATELRQQIDELQDDAEFLIHVGDIRSAEDGRPCILEEYLEVAGILNQSSAPVFIVLGDNEWNDCPNVDEAFDQWMTVFGKFDEQWKHPFKVIRHDTRQENFSFLSKRTLFFGLNLVGGKRLEASQWDDRLTDLFEWVRDRVESKILTEQPTADSVVIFGHANPKKDHSDFFEPLSAYLNEDRVSNVPFLYLNGDAHKWNYQTPFYGQPNFLRIQVEGGTKEPPLQVTLDNNVARTKAPQDVFGFDRMLSLLEIG